VTVINSLEAWYMSNETPSPGTEPEAVQPTIAIGADGIAEIAHLLDRVLEALREMESTFNRWRAILRDYDAGDRAAARRPCGRQGVLVSGD
jgi:hypothetical protein